MQRNKECRVYYSDKMTIVAVHGSPYLYCPCNTMANTITDDGRKPGAASGRHQRIDPFEEDASWSAAVVWIRVGPQATLTIVSESLLRARLIMTIRRMSFFFFFLRTGYGT